jgi:hypothetical protein
MKNIIATLTGMTQVNGIVYDLHAPTPAVVDVTGKVITPAISHGTPLFVVDYITDDATIDTNALYEAVWDGSSAYLTSVTGSDVGRQQSWSGWPTTIAPIAPVTPII